MKRIAIIMTLLLITSICHAQTFDEWFRQKRTQKRYLLEQIAALQIYIGYAQKGYEIVDKGLTTIGNIKNGEFNLHRDFFSSLKNINPKIKNYTRIAAIIALQANIIKTYKKAYKQVRESNSFNSDEINYIYRVYSRLIDDCTDVIDELITVTTANQLEMTDDERIKRINALYKDMQDKYAFAQSFRQDAILLTQARLRDKNDVQSSRRLNGLKNE